MEWRRSAAGSSPTPAATSRSCTPRSRSRGHGGFSCATSSPVTATRSAAPHMRTASLWTAASAVALTLAWAPAAHAGTLSLNGATRTLVYVYAAGEAATAHAVTIPAAGAQLRLED